MVHCLSFSFQISIGECDVSTKFVLPGGVYEGLKSGADGSEAAP